MRIPIALTLLLFGCGKEVPPPAAPRPRPAMPSTVSIDPPSPGRAAPRAPFSVLWSQQTKPDNRGVALSSSGALAVLSPGDLALYDRSGARLAERPVCTSFEGGLGFVRGDVVVLACLRELRFYGAPDLAERGVRSLPAEARGLALSGDVAAIAFASEVRLYDTDAWSERRTLPLPEPATALSLSSDHLAVGLDDGSALLIPLSAAGGVTLRIPIKPGLPVESLALSPDGARLAAASGPLVGVWQVSSGRELSRFTTAGGVFGLRWLGDDEIASVGRDGLILLDPARGASAGVGGVAGGDAPVGLAVTALAHDAQLLCAAGADGFVSCYGRGLSAGPALPLTASGSADERRMSGTVVSSSADKYEIRAHAAGDLPPAGQRVVLMRYVEVSVADARHGRWVEIADAEVLANGDGAHGVVEVQLIGALHNLEGLGAAEADPLGLDSPVKLVWHP